MSNLTRAMMMGAAGASGDKVYVDDVFSTYLYTGNSSTQTITNGIDLAGEGGLAIIRTRAAGGWRWIDTERGATKRLASQDSNPEGTDPTGLTLFTSTGFTLGSGGDYNDTNDYASWSFRKAPGFFDVVTYTGDGTAGRTVAHNLGSVPGMIIVKCTNTAGTNWLVYHRSLGATKAVILDLANASVGPSANYWNNTAPTSTHFTLGVINDVNTNGDTYVAYIFAHDDQSFGTNSDEAIIKCGSFTGANYTESLGFEPQFLLAKRSDATGGDWFLVDSMRGFYPQGTDSVNLRPNTTNDENTASFHLTSDGFYYSSSTATYIYMAIRRPHKPPTAATEVFNALAATGSTGTSRTVGFPADLSFTRWRSGSTPMQAVDRLRGMPSSSNAQALLTSSTGAEVGNAPYAYDIWNTTAKDGVNANSIAVVWHYFRRAPGFFDVVAYTGTGSTLTVNHNLGVTPELIIGKCRTAVFAWVVYHKDLGTGSYISLNTDASNILSSLVSAVSSTTFTGEANGMSSSGNTHIAYLFATLPGISKVGSYAGTGNAINVDCGFTAGARFILIKRTDSTGDWYVWDTARGIVSGNDPYLLLNSTAAEVTNTDYIDPLSSGFTVTSTAPAALNASGGNYIFLAIA